MVHGSDAALDSSPTLGSINLWARPGKYGYEPLKGIDDLSAEDQIEAAKIYWTTCYSEQKTFLDKFDMKLPDNWPKHPNGSHITHCWQALFRAADEKVPCDLSTAFVLATHQKKKLECRNPSIHQRGRAQFYFTKIQSMLCPYLFLQCTADFEDLRRAVPGKTFVRIDLIAAWRRGYFDENSLQDFTSRPTADVLRWCAKNKISKLGSWLIFGLRGPWWPPFSTLVDENDELCPKQSSIDPFSEPSIVDYGDQVKSVWAEMEAMASRKQATSQPSSGSMGNVEEMRVELEETGREDLRPPVAAVEATAAAECCSSTKRVFKRWAKCRTKWHWSKLRLSSQRGNNCRARRADVVATAGEPDYYKPTQNVAKGGRSGGRPADCSWTKPRRSSQRSKNYRAPTVAVVPTAGELDYRRHFTISSQ